MHGSRIIRAASASSLETIDMDSEREIQIIHDN